MASPGRILKDGLDALRKSADDMNVRLSEGVTKKIDVHLGSARRDVDGLDKSDVDLDLPDKPRTPKPENPPIDPDKNPDWLNDRLADPDLPFWRQRMAEGDQFNYQNHDRYPQNEVVLTNDKRLDSYDPGVAIVSRKNTQLDNVRPETARGYIDELLRKYPPGTGIKGGGQLDGTPILEIPVQNSPIPQSIIDHANGCTPRVVIRDVLGTVYN